jgi:hypothetical protein
MRECLPRVYILIKVDLIKPNLDHFTTATAIAIVVATVVSHHYIIIKDSSYLIITGILLGKYLN